MAQAIEQAKMAKACGEVPVGAVLVKDDAIIAQGHNQPIMAHDPSAHAEMVVLRKAGEVLGNYRLLDTTLYVTLEPCFMCAGLIVHARVKRVVFGALDPKAGVVQSKMKAFDTEFFNHRVDVTGGVLADECSKILTDFFKERRQK